MESMKAEEYIEKWTFDAADLVDADGVGSKVVRCSEALKAVKLAAEEEHKLLTEWHDPNKELPEPMKDVLVKCTSGSYVVDFYVPDLGCFYGEDATYMEVVGWREIHE